jgi:hypothetical protein
MTRESQNAAHQINSHDGGRRESADLEKRGDLVLATVGQHPQEARASEVMPMMNAEVG